MKNEWKKEFPTKPGRYWFYGYRYGKISRGYKQDPELTLVKVSKISNGVMYISDGQFMHKKEVECPNFKLVDLPELPELDD